MFYKKNRVSLDVFSCATGITRQLRDVKDQVFSVGSMGPGVVVYPTSNTIVSPVDGTVEAVFATNHCVGIRTKEDFEIIIHVGVDTIKMEGEGFKTFVKKGDLVKVGEPIIEADFDLIGKKGYKKDVLLLLHGPREKSEILEEVEPGLEINVGELAFKATMK